MKVSVIIPTFLNLLRRKDIERLLSTIDGQNLVNCSLEIILVNNSNNDPTWIGDLFARQNITFVNEKKIGLSIARNTGIKYASGEIIIFLDDDVWIDDNYISQIVNAFYTTGAICVGGKVLVERENYPLWMTDYFTRFILPPFYPNDLSMIFKPYYIIGASMAFRKEVFPLYGLFNESLGRVGNKLLSGEDIEIVKRLPKDKVYICPSAIVTTSIGVDRMNRYYYVKRLFWQGITDAILLNNHPHVEFYDLQEVSINNGLISYFLEKLLKLKIFEAVCVVIRYFGFILQSTAIKWGNLK